LPPPAIPAPQPPPERAPLPVAHTVASSPTPPPPEQQPPPPPPAVETITITLWRGYTKARFFAISSASGAPVASSEAFRWRASDAAAPSDAAARAHAALLATLAESGWRAEARTNAPWHEVVLQRTAEPAIARAEAATSADGAFPALAPR